MLSKTVSARTVQSVRDAGVGKSEDQNSVYWRSISAWCVNRAPIRDGIINRAARAAIAHAW